MSVPKTVSIKPAASALLVAAHDAEALRGERVLAAGVELARSACYGIDDETRARSAGLIQSTLQAVARALTALEPMLDGSRAGSIADRFVSAGLLERSGLAACALLRAEEHRLAAALVRVAGELEGPGASRLDPIGGEFAAESFSVRAAEAARTDRTGEPVLPLQDLAAEDRHTLIWQVAACLVVDGIAAGADEDLLHRAASAAVGRTLAAIVDEEGIGPAAMRLARRLDTAHQIDDALLAGTLASGRIASLAAMLAVRAAIGFDDARAMLTHPARCALLLRACDIERSVAAAMILTLALGLDRGYGPEPSADATDLIEGFDALPVDCARAEVRRARLEPCYRDALETLGGHSC